MSLEHPAPGITICRDTPQNWREFWQSKSKVTGCTVEEAMGNFYKNQGKPNPFSGNRKLPDNFSKPTPTVRDASDWTFYKQNAAHWKGALR